MCVSDINRSIICAACVLYRTSVAFLPSKPMPPYYQQPMLNEFGSEWISLEHVFAIGIPFNQEIEMNCFIHAAKNACNRNGIAAEGEREREGVSTIECYDLIPFGNY